ncbi:MAG: hypothetical protein V4448_16230 [Pseudomonadota bacterium]
MSDKNKSAISMVFAESGGATTIYCGYMEVQDDSYGMPSSGGLATCELSATQPDAPVSSAASPGLTRHSRLTLNPGMDAICFGSAVVPEAVDKSITLLIEKSARKAARIQTPLLDIAKSISRDYPSYLCAQFAEASLLSTGDSYEKVEAPLLKLWNIGNQALSASEVEELRFSASQGNASYLTGAAMFATFKVWKGDLPGALEIANRTIYLDVENGSQAKFIKAHIVQLMGDAGALSLLSRVASVWEPMAFYALGLEHLRKRNGHEAKDAFENGFNLAPTVAAILLGRPEFRKLPSRIPERVADRYVETFCKPEWTGEDISLLGKIADRYVRKKSLSSSSF